MKYGILISAACYCLYATVSPAQVAVPTAQYGPERTNSNQQEFVLSPQSVGSGDFGKLFTREVDDTVYASPLIVPNVEFGRGRRKTTRDLLFVATMSNTVYAFDATDPAEEDPIWSVNLGQPLTPSGSLWFLAKSFGIISTPAIDLETGTIYVVAKIVDGEGDEEVVGLDLFALDITNGELKFNSPQRMRFPHGGADLVDVPEAIQRAGLLVNDGVLYVAVAAVYPDPSVAKSQEGYVQSFNASNLAERLGSFQATPGNDEGKGGIWQAGRGIAADDAGNVYVVTAGGSYNGTSDWGSSVLKLAPPALTVLDWFTPSNWVDLFDGNIDPSANGLMLLPDGRAVAGGKEGVIYLLDRNNLGRLEGSPNGPLQRFDATDGCGLTDCAQTLGTAFWDGGLDESRLFVWDRRDNLRAFAYTSDGMFGPTPYVVTSFDTGPADPPNELMTGGPTVSSAGADLESAVVWAVTTFGNANDQFQLGTLRAYRGKQVDAGQDPELYNSDAADGDALGLFTKFAPPVAANGMVYVPTAAGVHDNAAYSGSVVAYGFTCQQDGGALVDIAAGNTKGPRKRLSQDFVVTNTGDGALPGPFALAFDALGPGASVSNSDGQTSCAAPAGMPYVLAEKAPAWLQPGESVRFKASYSGADSGVGSEAVRFLFGRGER